MSIIEHYRTARELALAPGDLLELTRVEIDGQSLLAYANAPGNMRDIWALSVGHGDSEYLVYSDERWTYTRAARDIAAFATWLKGQGIGSGDRVAIAMRNYPEWMLAHWAINSVGAVVVGMNAWWVADEMAYALNDSAPKLLIADDRRLSAFAEIRDQFPDMDVVAVREQNPPVPATHWAEAVAADGELPTDPIDPDSEACIFYTSGTTGRPKGAQLTHRSCVANIMNVGAMQRIYSTMGALSRGQTLDAAASPPPPVGLIATPLFHVTANN